MPWPELLHGTFLTPFWQDRAMKIIQEALGETVRVVDVPAREILLGNEASALHLGGPFAECCPLPK